MSLAKIAEGFGIALYTILAFAAAIIVGAFALALVASPAVAVFWLIWILAKWLEVM